MKDTQVNEILELTHSQPTHYIRNYGDSKKLLDVLQTCGLLKKDWGSGGTLYPNGTLVYWLTFKDMPTLCKFLVTFDAYAEKYNYADSKDGQWHMSFDIHDDPLTGVSNRSVTYYLIYKAQGTQLSEIDEAIEEICERTLKYWNKL